MRTCDVLIVGGGPAGSTCAGALRSAGADVIVIDRAVFPRDKVCAGWITPGVLRDLGIEPAEYRARGLVLQEIRGFRVGVIAGRDVETRYGAVVSYAIRRCEFDHFLLRQSGATILEGTPLRTLRPLGGAWRANEDITASVVVGAGGHFCPVARLLRGPHAPRGRVIAREAEVRLPDGGVPTDPVVPELYFCRDLDGYGWCIRKGDYLNVGIGRRDPRGFNDHVRAFARWLESSGRRVPPADAWRGHAYLLAGSTTCAPVGDGVLLVGDAAGLAYAESGEGIGPAVRSGFAAARVIAGAGHRYGRDELMPYAADVGWRRPAQPSSLGLPSSIGRMLLGSRAFTRHVVLDRWFLRSAGAHALS